MREISNYHIEISTAVDILLHDVVTLRECFFFQIKLYNLNFGINEKIEYMGWVNEGVLNNNHPWQSYCARFMIIRGRDVLLFDTPPVILFESDVFSAVGGRFVIILETTRKCLYKFFICTSHYACDSYKRFTRIPSHRHCHRNTSCARVFYPYE